jgi:hypothetical protein
LNARKLKKAAAKYANIHRTGSGSLYCSKANTTNITKKRIGINFMVKNFIPQK